MWLSGQGSFSTRAKSKSAHRSTGALSDEHSLFLNLFALKGVADTQCGFKMFGREAAISIFSCQKMIGFAFDVEILFLARQKGLSIEEIPVNWVAQPGSKVNLAVDSMKMLWDIARVRWLHRRPRGVLSSASRGLASRTP